ncbi:hypothetical protein ACROYT_G003089 [Oculina patagonica]
MIVTFQFVFCFLKEVFQSLLLKYHEGHSGDDECVVEDLINEQGKHAERSEAKGINGGFTMHDLVQSSTLQSGNIKSCENSIHSSNTHEKPLFSAAEMILEEDWDNDIVSHAPVNGTSLQTTDTEPSNSETYLSERNFYLGVTGNKDLFCEETSSTYSSDSDAWVGGSSWDQQSSYTRSLHLVSERDWLDELESLYFSDMITELKLLLPRAFEASKNCFDFVLYVVKFADFDIQAGKKSLAYLTLVEFEAWLKSKTEGRTIQEIQLLGYWPSDNHKDLALDIVVSSTFLLFEPIKRTFQLDSGENGFLTKHVRFLMHSKKKYKEAATIAYKLKLQTHFEVTEILLPLIIVDKLQLAESYVAGCPSSLQLFMKMIDDFCAMTDEELELVVEKTISPTPKDHRLKNKILVKLGERLVKMFHLKADNFPNIYKEKNLNGLRYLLQKKYSEKQPLNQKWDNLIETALGDNKWLQHKLTESLVEFDDIEEAARWTMFYCLPLESVHPLVKQLIDSWQATNEDSEDWEAEMEGKSEPRMFNDESFAISSTFTKFYRLPLPLDRIFLVDNAQSLRKCMRVLCVPGNVVGFDTEWRPTMCRAGTDERLAIIQLSTWSEVFILDMIALTDNVKDSDMQQFAENFFANPHVLKLGYGVDSDFRNLVSSCPLYEHSVKHLARFVDLCPLSKQILNIPSVRQKVGARMRSLSARERACIEEERGLSELVFLCLGLPLDKTYQISDWERRPLSDEQLIYAALDAYCLLEVYDVLKQWVVESRLRVNMEPALVLSWLQPKKEKQRRSRHGKPKPGTRSNDILPPAKKREPIPPQSLRVVVDTMFQGLGQHLRCCGVDVVILDNNGDHTRAVEIARTENRIIVTTGLPYEQLRSQVPEGMCVCVPCGKMVRQQVSALMKYFNVQVKKQDIFSRCQVCNGNDFVHVHQDYMRMVMGIFHSRFQAPLPGYEPKNCPVNLANLTLPGGVPLKLGPLPEELVNSVDVFFCCSNCGKVFWEGGHHKRIATQFSYLLDSSK